MEFSRDLGWMEVWMIGKQPKDKHTKDWLKNDEHNSDKPTVMHSPDCWMNTPTKWRLTRFAGSSYFYGKLESVCNIS
jgi:hypothetical protein